MDSEEQKVVAQINDLFFQLTQMLWEHVSKSHPSLGRDSLNITEHYLIEFLGKESFASMSKLSQIFHVAPTTMTSIVDRLSRHGYLKRERAHHDRRKVLVMLSEKGKQFYYDHQCQSLEVYTHYLAGLPDKGKKFSQNLAEIRQNLNQIKNENQ